MGRLCKTTDRQVRRSERLALFERSANGQPQEKRRFAAHRKNLSIVVLSLSTTFDLLPTVSAQTKYFIRSITSRWFDWATDHLNPWNTHWERWQYKMCEKVNRRSCLWPQLSFHQYYFFPTQNIVSDQLHLAGSIALSFIFVRRIAIENRGDLWYRRFSVGRFCKKRLLLLTK